MDQSTKRLLSVLRIFLSFVAALWVSRSVHSVGYGLVAGMLTLLLLNIVNLLIVRSKS